MADVTVTVLVENTAASPSVLGEWGLSFWIETPHGNVLFDTGCGHTLIENAKALCVDLSRTDAIVLSHGHYDHSGGLAPALDAVREVEVFLHPAALDKKFSIRPGREPRETGMPDLDMERISNHPHVRRLILTEAPTEVLAGVFVTGQVPRVTDFEDASGSFYKDAHRKERDLIPDDQALFFKCDKGVVIALGCAHAGAVNTLNLVRDLSGEREVHAAFGGMHLDEATPERIKSTTDALQRFNLRRFGPCHCTGLAATAAFWNAMPGRCFQCAAGMRLAF